MTRDRLRTAVAAAGALTQFPIGLDPGSNENDRIAVGPDGNVWVIVDTPPAAIARITPGGTITKFGSL